jgi:hypothetical protein
MFFMVSVFRELLVDLILGSGYQWQVGSIIIIFLWLSGPVYVYLVNSMGSEVNNHISF